MKFYNPFNIQKLSNEELIEHVNVLLNKYDDEGDTEYLLSQNVLYLTDVLFIYAELVSRYQQDYNFLKYQNDLSETKISCELKQNSTEKHPVSYYNMLAQEQMLTLRKEEFESQKRWCEMKLSLEATKEKINGIKKQIDSIRSESKF